jgi:GAF domain-containing protein
MVDTANPIQNEAAANAPNELERRVARAEQLIAFGQRIMGTLERDQVLAAVQEAAHQLTPAEGVSIALHREHEPTLYLYLIGKNRPTVIEFPYNESALRFVCNSGESLLLEDIGNSEYPDYKVLVSHAPPDGWEEEQSMHAALVVPLQVADRIVGTFNLTSSKRAAFTPDDLELAGQLATFLAVALENARLYAQAEDRISIERLMNELSGQQQGDIQTLFLNTLREVGTTLNARVGRVRLQVPTVEAVDVTKLRRFFDSGVFGKRTKDEIRAMVDAAVSAQPAEPPTGSDNAPEQQG